MDPATAWWLARTIHRAILRHKLRRASKRGEPIDNRLVKEADVNTEQVLGIARHVLTTLGGSLVTAGVLTEGELSTVVGAVVIVAGAVWSYRAKRKAE